MFGNAAEIKDLQNIIKSITNNNLEQNSVKLSTDRTFLSWFIAAVDGKDDKPQEAAKLYFLYHELILSIPKIKKLLTTDYSIVEKAVIDFIDCQALQFYGFDGKNRAILGYRTHKANANQPNLLLGNLFASIVLIGLLHDKYRAKNGMVMIMDHGGLTMSHYQLFLTNLSMVKIFARFFGEAIPINIHRQIVCNELSITNVVFTLARPFFTSESNR